MGSQGIGHDLATENNKYISNVYPQFGLHCHCTHCGPLLLLSYIAKIAPYLVSLPHLYTLQSKSQTMKNSSKTQI